MRVIANSSPLIALSRIDRLDIFQQLFGQLLIPHAVYQEIVLQCPNRLEKARLQKGIDTFIEIVHPRLSRVFSRNLGRGECEVLNLALDKHPDILLMINERDMKRKN